MIMLTLYNYRDLNVNFYMAKKKFLKVLKIHFIFRCVFITSVILYLAFKFSFTIILMFALNKIILLLWE